jgi:hypothetical protein
VKIQKRENTPQLEMLGIQQMLKTKSLQIQMITLNLLGSKPE